jgi:hypothetical protein
MLALLVAGFLALPQGARAEPFTYQVTAQVTTLGNPVFDSS